MFFIKFEELDDEGSNDSDERQLLEAYESVTNKTIMSEKVNEELVNVFVPTTPNPTSGFLLMVPKKDLIYLEVSF